MTDRSSSIRSPAERAGCGYRSLLLLSRPTPAAAAAAATTAVAVAATLTAAAAAADTATESPSSDASPAALSASSALVIRAASGEEVATSGRRRSGKRQRGDAGRPQTPLADAGSGVVGGSRAHVPRGM